MNTKYKATTQTQFKEAIQKYIYNDPSMSYSDRQKWTNKHCMEVGKIYKEQVWYCDNVLKTFPTAQIFHNEIDTLFIQYPTGGGKILIDRLEWDILIPEIETVCAKHGKRLFNVNHHLIAA